MRIIGGSKAGLRVQIPKNLPVRPTTDLAKEAFFNILDNKIDISELEIVLDLFSGTGAISLEFASRGAKKIHAVDLSYNCVQHLKNTAKNLGFDNITCFKSNAVQFVKKSSEKYDFIFADPPFDLDILKDLPEMILNADILKENGWFVLEHPSTLKLNGPQPLEVRKYGYSTFSFYNLNTL